MTKQSTAIRLNPTAPRGRGPNTPNAVQPVSISTLAPKPASGTGRQKRHKKNNIPMSHPARRGEHQLEAQNRQQPNYETNPPPPNQLKSHHLRHQSQAPRRTNAAPPAAENVPKFGSPRVILGHSEQATGEQPPKITKQTHHTPSRQPTKARPTTRENPCQFRHGSAPSAGQGDEGGGCAPWRWTGPTHSRSGFGF